MLLEMDRALSPDGKLVLSDFNDKGMEIINAVHNEEGRTHENSKVEMQNEKLQFKIQDSRIAKRTNWQYSPLSEIRFLELLSLSPSGRGQGEGDVRRIQDWRTTKTDSSQF